MPEQQQVGHLREAEALLADIGVHQIRQVITTVDQSALHGLPFAVNHAVAQDITDLGAADHNAGAVVVAQTAVDAAVAARFFRQAVMNLVICA